MKGGLNSKLHAVCDGAGKPIVLLLSERQMSGHKGARLILETLLSGSTLITDRGNDSNWFREALADKAITSCVLPMKSRNVSMAYDRTLYRQQHKVENVFAKLRDWRRSPFVTAVALTLPSEISASRQLLTSTSVNESWGLAEKPSVQQALMFLSVDLDRQTARIRGSTPYPD